MAAHVIRRHLVGLTAIDFDEETLHPIETELQRLESAAFAFLALQLHQEILRVATEEPQLVQQSIVAWRDHAAVAKQVRRRPGESAREHAVLLGMRADVAGQLRQQLGRRQRRRRVEQRCLQFGQHRERIA